MNEKELISNIASKTGVDIKTVEKVFNTAIEQIVESLKDCESVTIRNFGRFYIRPGNSRTMVFKFSPSQRLRKIFGWSSTYKGKV
jgi:DNA-binding protein HU-beta